MQAQPKPVSGAVIGFFFGIVTVALLWQLGVLPPDRLVLFGIVAVTTMLTTILLTQRFALVPKRFVFLVILASLMGGVALTGIPESVGGGSLSDGCTLEASSSQNEATTPGQTSASAPFAARPDDTVAWNAASDQVLTDWSSAAGMSIGGFNIRLWNGATPNTEGINRYSGSKDVATLVDDLRNASGLELTGIYHGFGYIHATGGDCDADAYVLVAPQTMFDTPLLIGLWALGAILLIVIVVLAIRVRRSISGADRLRDTTPPTEMVGEGTTTGTPAPASEPEFHSDSERDHVEPIDRQLEPDTIADRTDAADAPDGDRMDAEHPDAEQSDAESPQDHGDDRER